jgi:hypothetical protein
MNGIQNDLNKIKGSAIQTDDENEIDELIETITTTRRRRPNNLKEQ